MPIDIQKFAEDCVRQGLLIGANPHYLLAVAKLRSGISDGRSQDEVGPFRLTQAQWDANCDDASFGVDLIPSDIANPELQCVVFALMSHRAFEAFVSEHGRVPSAKELYLAQWPLTALKNLSADLQMALDTTAPLIAPASAAILGDLQSVAFTMHDLNLPIPGTAGPAVATKAGRMSVFGGPNDSGIQANEDLHLYDRSEIAESPDLFLSQQPPGTTGSARRLNPEAPYVSCRWDYSVTPKNYLRSIRVKISNPANSKSADARPVDWGPSESTGRIAELSPGLAKMLGLKTDDVCTIEIPLPATRVFAGPRLGDVLDRAFMQRQSRSTNKSFGAAGRRGPALDVNLSSLLPRHTLSPDALQMTSPMNRMLSTNVGARAANAVGNEEKALVALQRLSLETMAAALRDSGQARGEDRLLVIPAKGSRPPTLMLMSTDISDVGASRLASDEMDLPLRFLVKGASEAADPNEGTPEGITLRQVLHGGEAALAELFLITQPEIIHTRQPRMIPMCVPLPHMSIESETKLSTIGMLCRDADGELGVTACFHGTGPAGTQVTISDRRYQVKSCSEVQDIAFIPLYPGFNLPQMRGRGGLLIDREPARADRVRFDGATNQGRSTRIFATDAGLLRARPSIMLKLQTDPDTDEGDSGCTLLDENDRVLGFAFQRTAYDDYPQFTDWIWAANALRALQLTAI